MIVVGGWQLVVDWWLAVGSSRLAVGWLVVGGWLVGWLVVDGRWLVGWRLAVGRWQVFDWWLALVVGGWRLVG